MVDPTLLLIVISGLALGGFVKGMTGMGAPLVSVPILASVLGVPRAIALLSISYLVSNLYQIGCHARGRIGQRYLIGFLMAGILGTAVGTVFVVNAPIAVTSLILGLLLVAYCIMRLIRRAPIALPPAVTRKIAPAVGLASGLLHGAAGISSPIGGVFLQMTATGRSQYIFAVSTMLLLFSLTQAIGLFSFGVFDLQLLVYGLLALLPVFGGLLAGSALSARISPSMFDLVFTFLIAIMGINLIVKGAMETMAS